VLAAAAALAALLSSCATAQAPRIALEYYEIGNAWLAMEKWDKAGAAYERALAYDRSLVAASYNLARALAEAGAYPRALEVLERLRSDDPDNVRLIAFRAYVLNKSGDDEAALAAYRRAAELNPRDAGTLRNLALLLERAGRDGEALVILRELYAVNPADDGVLRRLALLEARRVSGTRGSGESPAPGEESAPAITSTAAAAASAEEDALTLLSAYLSRKPGDREVLRARAELREARELFARAQEDWAALAQADPADGEAWFRLARIRLVVAGDREAGMEALRKALDAKFSDSKAAAALLAALPEAERAKPAELLKAAGLSE